MARLIKLKEYETEGERSTAGTLAAGLPEEWVVIYGAMLAVYGPKYYEVDFFVVGHHGVYLVDDKFFKGKLEAGRGHWRLRSREIPNPVEKAEMVAKRAAGQILEGVAGFGRGLGQRDFMHAYISLSGQVDLVRQDTEATARVMLAHQLPQALLTFDHLPANQSLPVADFRDAIVDYLTAGRNGVDPSEPEPVEQLSKAEEPAQVAAATESRTVDGHRRRRRLPILSWIPVACLLALAAVSVFAYWSSRPVRWDDARAHVGETATVYGPVVQSVKKPKWGDLSYIDVGSRFQPGSATPFYLRIDPEYRAAVEAGLRQLAGNSPSPWDAFGTKTIWVKSQVLEDSYGGAYMLVTSAKDIHLGEPSAQSGYLVAALVAAGVAIGWSLVLVVKSTRRRWLPASDGGIAP